MSDPISIGKPVRLRDCGFDEYWLQEKIFENPSILHLGELEALTRERKQSSGGKLDILLKNAEDNSMYEVEVMLGHTDESHIIRAIEYWDIEKRRWPNRQHFCVIVAEVITRRFFNVIQILSNSIPVIAIQANIVEADGRRILHFTKVLDVYEEPEDSDPSPQDGTYDEAYWRSTAPWTVDTATSFISVVRQIFPEASLGFVKNYISVAFRNANRIWLRRRSDNITLISTWLEEPDLETAKKFFDQTGIQYEAKKNEFKFRIKPDGINKNADILKKLLTLMAEY